MNFSCGVILGNPNILLSRQPRYEFGIFFTALIFILWMCN